MPTVVTKSEVTRPVIYPQVEVHKCFGIGAISEVMAKNILGWETECEYQRRCEMENPGTHQWMYEYGDVFSLMDLVGNKVRLWHVVNAVPINGDFIRNLTLMILSGKVTDDSAVVISKTGRVHSGYNLLTALVLANQNWRQNPSVYPTAPTVEALVTVGVEDQDEEMDLPSVSEEEIEKRVREVRLEKIKEIKRKILEHREKDKTVNAEAKVLAEHLRTEMDKHRVALAVRKRAVLILQDMVEQGYNYGDRRTDDEEQEQQA